MNVLGKKLDDIRRKECAVREREIKAMMLLACASMDVLPKEYAAVYCDLSEDTLEKAAEANEILCYKRRSRLFFPKASLNDYMHGEKALQGKQIIEEKSEKKPRRMFKAGQMEKF
jgi:hypothetical protein